jgi:hypothetical protein
MMTEAQLLSRQLNKARELSLWYLSLLKDCDTKKTFAFNDKTFNSYYWEVGHMAVTESYLSIYLTYGKAPKIEWAKLFGLGSSVEISNEHPPFSEIWKIFKEVHQLAINHVALLTDAQLNEPTKVPFKLAGVETVRDAIIHCIRHESVHTGHLSWLCKFHGVKTI